MSRKQDNPDVQRSFLVSLIRSFIRNWRFQLIRFKNRGKISRGKNAYVGPGANVYIPNFVKMGDNVSIGADFISQVNLTIGNDSLISSR
ncbi:hypothetical protein, partial [Klebsiella pneumoniae]